MSTTSSTSTDTDALQLLDSVADNLLRLQPEGATSLGIDTGARAALRSQLADRSADGQQRLARQVKADLDRVNAFNTDGLSHATRTSIDVVRSAYATALEGFALPYGDITVGGWRNTPYVVIQNVGAYLDVPRFLDSDHPNRRRRGRRSVSRPAAVVREAARWRARTDAGRARRRTRAPGVPDRQGDRADDALREERARGRVDRRVDRAENEEHSRRLGRGARGRSRRRRSRPRWTASWRNSTRSAPSRKTTPASAARPHGEEFYRWALKASTTTTMSPGRNPRDGQERAAAAARADGRDPERDRLLEGQRRRADESAREGSAVQVLRRRQGPRRDHGVHPGPPRNGFARRCRARSTRSSIRTWK